MAAAGTVTLVAKSSVVANLIQGLYGSNFATLEDLFIHNNAPLLFDTGGPLAGLTLLQEKVAGLQEKNGNLSDSVS